VRYGNYYIDFNAEERKLAKSLDRLKDAVEKWKCKAKIRIKL
jgi:hypothetical protein